MKTQHLYALMWVLYIVAGCLLFAGFLLGSMMGLSDGGKEQIAPAIALATRIMWVGLFVLALAVWSTISWVKHKRDERIRNQDV